MSRFLSIILLFLSIGIVAKSQNITPMSISYFNSSAYNGKVKIKQDAKLKNFVETSVGLNKKRNGFYGYRVKIYAENHLMLVLKQILLELVLDKMAKKHI